MKKLIFILFAFMSMAVFGQVDTIYPHANYVLTIYDDGNWIATGTGSYAGTSLYMEDSVKITITTGQNWTPLELTGGITYRFGDFGYSTGPEMFDYLCCLYFQEYYVTYVNIGGSIDDMDSIFYRYPADSSIVYSINRDYDGDTLASEHVIIY